MEIIRTIDTTQNIKVLPRELITSVRFILEDKEQPSNIIDTNVTATIINDFIQIPFSGNFFKEGRRYFIKVLNGSDERIWMGEAYCTDKTDLQNFKVDE